VPALGDLVTKAWWLACLLVACGEPDVAPATPDEPRGFAAARPVDVPDEVAAAAAAQEEEPFIPRGGARMFVRGRPEVTFTTVRSGGVTEQHRAAVGAGVVYTSDALTLGEAEGVLEVSLTSWSSDDPERDGLIRRLYFDTEKNPVAYVELHELEPFELEAKFGATVSTRARGAFVLGDTERPFDVAVEISRVEDGYGFRMLEGLPISIDLLDRPRQRSALVVQCSEACRFADEVIATLSFEITWNYGVNEPRAPGRAPKSVYTLTGEGNELDIERGAPPTPFVLEDNGRFIWENGVRRDIMKDPTPEDVRTGRIKLIPPKGTPDDAKDDPVIELWTK
jgi:hypothetical protein